MISPSIYIKLSKPKCQVAACKVMTEPVLGRREFFVVRHGHINVRYQRRLLLQRSRASLECLHTASQSCDRFMREIPALLWLQSELQPVSDKRMQGESCSLLVRAWCNALQQRKFFRGYDDVPKSIRIPYTMEALVKTLIACLVAFVVNLVILDLTCLAEHL